MVLSMLYVFSDDTKLYHTAPQDPVLLQRNLARIVDWFYSWQMSFNVEKCHIMSIGNFPLPSYYSMKFGDFAAYVNYQSTYRMLCWYDVCLKL